MSDINMVVGQQAVGQMSFSESGAPSDGAVMSSDPSTATISLDPDGITWTVQAVNAPDPSNPTVVTMSYTGTSMPPDTGPVVVSPMTIAVSAAPIAETGNFNPSSATIT